ncbi:MAG: hypothetical protein JNJ73_11930 [Hyphomonadaceae bacterium]|nr:hypothetical protein [Hyphomonadaceae bacterium]
MKGIIRTLLIIVAIIVVGGVAGYFVLPAKASRAESFTVARPPASVFARIASTPPGTVIAEGVTQTAITSAENNVVVAEVAYADGSTGVATYTVAPDGEGSRVELKLEQNLGANPMDKLGALTGGEVGPLVTAAAAAVTTDLNALPAAAFTGLAYEVTTVTARPFLYNQNCSPQDASQIKEAVAQSLVVLKPLLTRFNLTQDGPPIAVETSWENNQYCFQIGFAFTGTPPRLYAGGTVGTTPAGQAIRVHYSGAEENVIPTYDQMEALIASARLTQGKSFEIYYDDPAATGGSVSRDIFYLVEGDATALARVAPSAGAVPAAASAPPAAPAAAPAAPAAAPAATTPAPEPAKQ